MGGVSAVAASPLPRPRQHVAWHDVPTGVGGWVGGWVYTGVSGWVGGWVGGCIDGHPYVYIQVSRAPLHHA